MSAITHTPTTINFKELAREIVAKDTAYGWETDFRYAMAMVREHAEMGLISELIEQYRENTPERQLDELIALEVA